MSCFREELRTIPRSAWIMALLLYLAVIIIVAYFGLFHQGLDSWSLMGKGVLLLLAPLVVFLPFMIFGYVYGDAKRRGMNYVAWTLLSIFVPYLIGLILYFCLRDPLPLTCSSCRKQVPAKFTFCPHCGQVLGRHCPQCGKALEPSWVNCGYCGTKLSVDR